MYAVVDPRGVRGFKPITPLRAFFACQFKNSCGPACWRIHAGTADKCLPFRNIALIYTHL